MTSILVRPVKGVLFTVDKKGKIKEVEKGTCEIWVYAQNGRGTKLSVVVS